MAEVLPWGNAARIFVCAYYVECMPRDVNETALNLLLDHIINITCKESFLKRKRKKALYFEMAQKGGHLRSYERPKGTGG